MKHQQITNKIQVSFLTAFLLVFLLIHNVLAAEIRFYTVRETSSEEDVANKTVGSIIQNLVISGRQHKIDQILGGKQGSDSKLQQYHDQCQVLHKMFRKYKREFNSDQSMADEPWHSVSSTAYIKVHSPRTAKIPLGIKADVSRESMRCERSRKFNFGDTVDVNKQMEAMEWKKDDEKGHLITARLCGPAKWYNLSPQTPAVSNSLSGGHGWAEGEKALRKWLEQEGGRLEILLVLQYKNLQMTRTIKELPEGARRPTDFATCYRLYDRIGSLRAEYYDTINNHD